VSEGPALVVGLGNPGPEYERTRHNLGYRVVDTLASRLGVSLKPSKGKRALVAEARDGDARLILAEPTTYMNLSGEAVGELARYYKVDLEDIVVVHDDLDLPTAAIRLKRGGGDGGHNGLKHITRALGSPEYARVRIGIGRPPGRKDAVDYVLQPFSKKEEETVAVAIEEAADAVMLLLREDLEAAQQRYHAGAEKEPKPQRAIRKEIVVPAPVDDVFAAWTTREGARTFFAPDARIELRPGGAYEILFDLDEADGRKGSEGCTVLAFRRPEFLVFSWNAPPEYPEIRDSSVKTRVELKLQPDDGRTRLSLTHSGWRRGGRWDEVFEYFERAWDVVLDQLKRSFESGPIDWR
jgi:PTH1 family peptidyl-tRNA hydrolase